MDYTFLGQSLDGVYYAVLGMFLKLTGRLSLKDIIIRNFLARSCTCLQSIRTLAKSQSWIDAWVLYRSLMDRLIHLRYLEQTGTYSEFDDWSFKAQYEYNNAARSDVKFKDRIDPKDFFPSDDEKARYKSICSKDVKWKRPKAEDVARTMEMTFLYKYGYDYASTLVHPMANDGDLDYHRIVQSIVETNEYAKNLMPNSILIGSMVLQEGLNNSTPQWMALVYNSINGIRQNLAEQAPEKLAPLRRLARYVSADANYQICQFPGEKDQSPSK